MGSFRALTRATSRQQSASLQKLSAKFQAREAVKKRDVHQRSPSVHGEAKRSCDSVQGSSPTPGSEGRVGLAWARWHRELPVHTFSTDNFTSMCTSPKWPTWEWSLREEQSFRAQDTSVMSWRPCGTSNTVTALVSPIIKPVIASCLQSSSGSGASG